MSDGLKRFGHAIEINGGDLPNNITLCDVEVMYCEFDVKNTIAWVNHAEFMNRWYVRLYYKFLFLFKKIKYVMRRTKNE